uniref:Uncharacterized protein n=1 Tax=Timema bartmani TaxID=61472 RepID=A0A7R9F3G2_9NEOP|nr:unnamed protein product [Timema bartmani]
MCILFLYTKPMVEDGEYRVILASNRDENYTRPAQVLATWIDNPVIMGDLPASVALLANAPVVLSSTAEDGEIEVRILVG